MTNMLAEIFVDYGKSSNVFIITIAMIFFIIGLIFGVAAIVLTVLNKFNWIDFYFYCISLLSLIGFLVVFLVGIIRVGNDVSRNIETAIRKEYADVNFLQTGITGQFISNGNTYEYIPDEYLQFLRHASAGHGVWTDGIQYDYVDYNK